MTTFTLTIELENDAMRTAEDIVYALRELATALENGLPTTGMIRDINGNTVGRHNADVIALADWRSNG